MDVMRYRLFLAAALAALAATISAQQTDPQTATAKLTTVLADLVRTPASSLTASQVSDTAPRSVRDALQSHRLRIDANNEVQVYILVSEVTDATAKQLTDAGVTIEIADAARRRVQAHVPVSRLTTVAQLGIVDAIRLPTYARPRGGKVTTEGDAILFANNVRGQLSLDGTGVRVGVVSDGLKGVFATGCVTGCTGVDGGPIATGDLPSSTGLRTSAGVLKESSGGITARSFQANGDLEGLPPASPACAFAGAGAEGTALLEIVHDIAPGAKLSFANGDTDLAFNQAVNFLAASNDVVVDDIGFLGEPYDGTSSVSLNTAAALNNPSNPIRAYVTAVGNDADDHYFGAYVDSGVDGTSFAGITTPGHVQLFQRSADTTDVLALGAQPYNVIALPQNGEAAIFLTWNDSFGGSGNNYDLYLVQQSTGRVVASSTDVQSGRQDPVEVIDYVNKGAADRFLIVVQNVRGAAQPRNLNIYSVQPECAVAGPALLSASSHARHNYNTATRSVSAQGDAGGSPVSVISVGAICSASAAANSAFATDESCLDTSNRTPEFFSSRGPTLDGRQKPDITAIDGVSVTGAGSFPAPFFGTSAAAPHVAGIAALLLQSAPCLLNRAASTASPDAARAAIRNLLISKAGAVGTSPDNIVGVGRVDAFASVAATLPSWKGKTQTLSVDANSTFGAALSGEQLGFVDPDGCGLVRLTWTGGCGTSPGATMTCPAGANAVTVSASNNGFGFSGTVDLTVKVSDFGIGVTPGAATVSAGQTTRQLVTIAPQGGAFNSDVTLTCAAGNLPPQTTCTFDPPVVRPGTSGATSTLTITTSSAASSLTASSARGQPRQVTAQSSGIGIFPSTLTFVAQTVSTTSPPQLVSLTNTGADALTVTSITAVGDYAAVNNCGTSLASGASCSVSVTFTPSSTGTRIGTLSFADDATGSPHAVSLSGTGQAAPTGTGATPTGSYTVTVSGTSGTSLAHFGTVTLTVQ